MHKQTIIIQLLYIGLFYTACERVENINNCGAEFGERETDTLIDSDMFYGSDEKTIEEVYLEAIKDAVFTDSDEIDDDLIAVTTDDDRVIWLDTSDEARLLVVTWTSYPDSYPPGETVTNDWGNLWVTIAPELKERLSDFNDTSSLRIAQLLGMPPDTMHSHFVTLWVKPSEIFRPCPDNEITDSSCGFTLPEEAEEWYVDWYNQNILSSYFPASYPWTRLGYTYDWAPGAEEKGLSEFVVKKGSSLIVESIETTKEYFTD